MKTVSSVIILSLIVLFSSCGTTKTADREKFTVSPYGTVVSSAGIEVYFSHAKSYTADVDKGDKINVSVRDGSLILSRRGGGRSGGTKVYLSAEKLDAVILSGGSRFFSDELKNVKKISLTTSGGSGVDIKKIDIDECNIAASGGSACSIRQIKTRRLNVASSGGSTANIETKRADNVNVAASGGSNVTLTGSADNISASASGSASINVTGLKYKNINTNQSGRGNIRK
ncbi:GIN domain-containing protein [Dysgonomonas sp. 521]|uniref:GIN domain-containing protein n=1 Tax=Dysgonomonas sp. 521 TaxID=2302932 RepID=UPI0013D75CAA|nr:DUF2807 domain-containing protein [Dysgonomonas sp. 521]